MLHNFSPTFLTPFVLGKLKGGAMGITDLIEVICPRLGAFYPATPQTSPDVFRLCPYVRSPNENIKPRDPVVVFLAACATHW